MTIKFHLRNGQCIAAYGVAKFEHSYDNNTTRLTGHTITWESETRNVLYICPDDVVAITCEP